ncbi:hypothetical protein A3B56_00880 [Candidatus Roizmanbacteria bacterium RIFCSPLOWO2_01_FULL_45_11]|uniref:Uncharacterized protein n=1 Tax=Candidatus Roizmanbacteria bacterium RIFCSPLOWO2_01_FULL_45_11 TaxID=1802070 RepID=A0A1F7JDI2_9BACT|nr:MAG: hypothetical protein A3B56_00880 [Candidatus Roizmanbacteria bacterium RIFCSPLOWO2_01_FULL_45_11]
MKNSSHLITEELTLPASVMAQLHAQAKKHRTTISEYVGMLVQKMHTLWPPVPKHVNDRWNREIKEFEEEEKRGLHKTYHTVKELMQDLNT